LVELADLSKKKKEAKMEELRKNLIKFLTNILNKTKIDFKFGLSMSNYVVLFDER
jgi:hypothetical protein